MLSPTVVCMASSAQQLRPTRSRLGRLLGRTGRMTPAPGVGPQTACQTRPHTLQERDPFGNQWAPRFSQESHRLLYRGTRYSRRACLPALPPFLPFWTFC